MKDAGKGSEWEIASCSVNVSDINRNSHGWLAMAMTVNLVTALWILSTDIIIYVVVDACLHAWQPLINLVNYFSFFRPTVNELRLCFVASKMPSNHSLLPPFSLFFSLTPLIYLKDMIFASEQKITARLSACSFVIYFFRVSCCIICI